MKLTVIIILLVLSINIFSSSLFETYDVRSYSPIKLGVRDLTFTIKVDGLVESIKKRIPTLEVKEIYYKVYWVVSEKPKDNKIQIDIYGLGKGFSQLKEELRALVVNRLDFVIPQNLSNQFANYKLEQDAKTVRAIDKSNIATVPKVEIHFDNDGKIDRMETRSPLGFQKSKLEMDVMPWSKNKWVLKTYENNNILGPQITNMITKIEYEIVNGVGLPSTVNINQTQKIPQGGNKEYNEFKSELNIRFSDYKVNTGGALEYFRKHEAQ